MSDFEWEQWTMFMDVYAYDLDSLSHILGHEFFKYGVQIVWHHGYVSIDLKDIIEYFDLNYKKRQLYIKLHTWKLKNEFLFANVIKKDYL